MVTFKYQESLFGTKKPIADLFIKSRSGEWVKFHPYIDSGADVTLIPLSIGRLAGLTTEGKRVHTIGGISGGIPVIYHTLEFRIGNITVMTEVAWAQVENVPSLLGRKDIFDKFHITFKQDEGKIIFTEVKSKK